MARRLSNYLRTFRKRSGLSQREIAFLIGSHSASRVSRYEQSGRLPNLRTEIAFEAVFQASASELFGGLFDETARAVRRRAGILVRKLSQGAARAGTERKLRALRSMLGGSANTRS